VFATEFVIIMPNAHKSSNGPSAANVEEEEIMREVVKNILS